MSAETRFVVKAGEGGGLPRVERTARLRFVGHREPEPTADEAQIEFMLGLRDAGTGPEPVLSYSDDGEAHLSWPDVAAADPELARLVALASVPLGREVPELAGAEPDPEVEAEIERLVHEDRERTRDRTRLISNLAEALAPVLAAKQRRERRMRRARQRNPKGQPVKAPPQEPDRFEGELTADGWRWQPVARARSALRARARLRR